MNLERVAALMAYTTIAALGALIFCVEVLWLLPADVRGWFAAFCVSAGVALTSSIGEIVLRRRLLGMQSKAAVR
ncbi:hypothetical protein [Burkholderia ubonensis]|uniref:hypothetical protein n=1 Tax=Burkholderia ubonensis TaxID=101571 RepID=UPI000752422B|nr:hypothetical protein [Burkholderia ubonensis]KVO15108.1 hypothetical protein WJ74_10665 [Burkholderia ubonensis]KVT01167.1 hypothetical protein WK47_25165 [Burkholderia ubonensis]KVT07400.1 hypothetical protein WK46_10740 [Burkholderia ubonensis]KVT33822.1 hypothetical protein WK50_02540 [Burkholderia ubonensis]